ncbi:MAG: hypothetical protein MI739_11150 [Bacteroidales bacterium]|nr:hypothetical protein [Bacteroidales bacterium]
MKNLKLLFIAIIAIVISSCSKDDPEPKGHFIYKGETYDLECATVYDLGESGNLSFRSYKVAIMSSQGNHKNQIKFGINSSSLDCIELGTYKYKNLSSVKNFFYGLTIEYDLEYNEDSKIIGGKRITWYDSDVDFEGTVTVSEKGEDRKFTFDITVIIDGKKEKLTGEFCGELNNL